MEKAMIVRMKPFDAGISEYFEELKIPDIIEGSIYIRHDGIYEWKADQKHKADALR